MSISRKIFVLCFAILLLTVNNSYSQYDRKVIFEEFTEVWCGPCASVAPMLSAWIENHENVIPIMYSSYFIENGSKVNVATEDYSARNKFYGVPFYPYGRLNGNALPPNKSYPGFPTDTAAMTAVIDTMSNESPVKIELDFINNGAIGSVDVNIISKMNLNKKKLHVFIIEKHHTFAKQSNGMTEFHDIFRESATPALGEDISIAPNGEIQLSYNYELSGNVNYELYAVAIIQDPVSHFIIQSERVFAYPTSVYDTENAFGISVYPNPAQNILNISLNDYNFSKFEIVNYSGETVKELVNQYNIDISELPAGTYFLKAISDKKVISTKFIKN